MDLEKESKKIKIKNKQKMVRGRYVLKAPKPLPLEMSMLVEKNKYDSIQKRSVSSNRKIVLLPDFKPTTESKEGPGMSPKFWQKTGRGYVGKHRPKSTFVRKKNTIDKKKRIISFLPSGTKQRKTRSSRHVEGKIENAEEVKAKEVKNEELKEAEVKKIKDEGVKEAEPKLSEIKKNDADAKKEEIKKNDAAPKKIETKKNDADLKKIETKKNDADLKKGEKFDVDENKENNFELIEKKTIDMEECDNKSQILEEESKDKIQKISENDNIENLIEKPAVTEKKQPKIKFKKNKDLEKKNNIAKSQFNFRAKQESKNSPDKRRDFRARSTIDFRGKARQPNKKRKSGNLLKYINKTCQEYRSKAKSKQIQKVTKSLYNIQKQKQVRKLHQTNKSVKNVGDVDKFRLSDQKLISEFVIKNKIEPVEPGNILSASLSVKSLKNVNIQSIDNDAEIEFNSVNKKFDLNLEDIEKKEEKNYHSKETKAKKDDKTEKENLPKSEKNFTKKNDSNLVPKVESKLSKKEDSKLSKKEESKLSKKEEKKLPRKEDSKLWEKEEVTGTTEMSSNSVKKSILLRTLELSEVVQELNQMESAKQGIIENCEINKNKLFESRDIFTKELGMSINDDFLESQETKKKLKSDILEKEAEKAEEKNSDLEVLRKITSSKNNNQMLAKKKLDKKKKKVRHIEFTPNKKKPKKFPKKKLRKNSKKFNSQKKSKEKTKLYKNSKKKSYFSINGSKKPLKKLKKITKKKPSTEKKEKKPDEPADKKIEKELVEIEIKTIPKELENELTNLKSPVDKPGLGFGFMEKTMEDPKALNLSISPVPSLLTINTKDKEKKKKLPNTAISLNNQEKEELVKITTDSKKMGKNITATCFIVYETMHQKILISRGLKIRREIASLTKIMTCFTVLEFVKKHELQMESTLFEVSKKAYKKKGTSAKIVKRTFMNVRDLLFGIMLPSGNDAALCLAENIGRLIRLKKGKNLNRKLLNYKECPRPDFHFFIDLMNENRKKLKMKNSFFMNPHGLNNPRNFSTCQDLIILCQKALENPIFQEIVRCREYQGSCFKRVLKEEFKQKMIKEGKTLSVSFSSTDSSQKSLGNSVTESKNLSVSYVQGTAINESCNLSKFSNYVSSNISNTVPMTSIKSNLVVAENSKRVRFDPQVNTQSVKKMTRFSTFKPENKQVKSIIKKNSKYGSNIKVKNQGPSKDAKHQSAFYLLNKKKKTVEKKVARFGKMRSKKDFYDKIKDMFIQRIDNPVDEDAKLEKERKQILQKKLYKPKNNVIGVTGRPSRFSNKNLIYRSTPHTEPISLFDAQSASKTLAQSMNRQNSTNLFHARLSKQNNSDGKMRNSSVPRSNDQGNAIAERQAVLKPVPPLDIAENPFKPKSTAILYNSKDKRLEKKNRKSRSPVKRRQKSMSQKMKFKDHMKYVKDFWGKSIKEIQGILMDEERYSYDPRPGLLPKWKNSNLLLFRNEAYNGIKTGNTSNAKFCLATVKTTKDFEFLTSR